MPADTCTVLVAAEPHAQPSPAERAPIPCPNQVVAQAFPDPACPWPSSPHAGYLSQYFPPLAAKVLAKVGPARVRSMRRGGSHYDLADMMRNGSGSGSDE